MDHFAISRLTSVDVKAGAYQIQEIEMGRVYVNPNYELLAVVQGSVYLQVEGLKYELKSGEFIMLQPWEKHYAWRRMPAGSGFIQVQFAANPPLQPFDIRNYLSIGNNFLQNESSDLRTADYQNVQSLIIPRKMQLKQRYKFLAILEELLYEIEHPRGYFRMRESIILSQALEMIASAFLEELDLDNSLPASFLVYRKLVNYLHTRYADNIGQNEIESEVGRSYPYLCQIFKRYSGMTISSYIQQLKIQLAKNLLATTSDTLESVARKVGFKDHYYFSRVFKKVEAMSPIQYRHQTVQLGGPSKDKY